MYVLPRIPKAKNQTTILTFYGNLQFVTHVLLRRLSGGWTYYIICRDVNTGWTGQSPLAILTYVLSHATCCLMAINNSPRFFDLFTAPIWLSEINFYFPLNQIKYENMRWNRHTIQYTHFRWSVYTHLTKKKLLDRIQCIF